MNTLAAQAFDAITFFACVGGLAVLLVVVLALVDLKNNLRS